MSGPGEARQRLIDALTEEHNPSYWGGEPRNAERLVNDFAHALGAVVSAVHVVTENVGYDVGTVIRGVFSTRQKADRWIETQRFKHAVKVREGRAAGWDAPSYDIEEYQIDPEAKP